MDNRVDSKLRLGDVLEVAIWKTGDEPEGTDARFKKDMAEQIQEMADMSGVVCGDIKWSVKAPGMERVPPVPGHIQGQRVRLLIGEAEIVGELPAETTDSLIANLEYKDLQTLRGITRSSHQRHFPGRTLLDAECDDIIEALGPEAAVDALRTHAGQGRPH